MIRRRPPPPPSPQLDLFAARPKPKPAPDTRVLVRQRDGWFNLDPAPSGPTSRFTGGPLCAIEAVRVLRGLSIDVAGLLSSSGAWCGTCLKFLSPNPVMVCLFQPATANGRALEGAAYDCTNCNQKFTAQRC